MANPNPRVEMDFRDFLTAAAGSAEDLEFLADNLGEELSLDYSLQSLEKAEKLFWRFAAEGMPEGLGKLNDVAHLLARYCGECAIRLTNAHWVIPPQSHPFYPQPILDGFGKQAWDQAFPIDLANHLLTLPKSKPDFPGVREKRAFAAMLEQIVRTHQRSRSASP